MLTIGKVADKFRLSRSTLIYYDSIGLLEPSCRSDSNYRLYSREDQERLEKICLYREVGIPLQEIKKLLDAAENENVTILEKQLAELNDRIKDYRRQQHLIVSMLKNKEYLKGLQVLNKDTMVSLLSAIASGEGIDRFHYEFEQKYPEQHRSFLELMGMKEEDIRELRESYAGEKAKK